MDTAYKLYAMILEEKLRKEVDRLKLLPETQAGFRKGRSGIENIYIMKTVAEKALSRKGGKLYIFFADLKAAFDKVDRKKLNEAQKRKKAIYLECLAVKECVRYWQHLLIGRKFKVFSDHKPLENLNIKSRTDEELGDLTYYLSQYDLEIKYEPGKYNLEADCLSRNPVLNPDENMDEQLKIVNIITLDDILIDQKKNKKLQSTKEKLISRENIFYKKIRKTEKIILSEKFSIEFLKKIHTDLCHIGSQQMRNNICPYYTANNLIKNIEQICKSCTICIKNKSRGQLKYGLMSYLGPATKPFEIMSIDTIGGFHNSCKRASSNPSTFATRQATPRSSPRPKKSI